MTTVVLNVKIDAGLKEQLRHHAEANNETLGATTQKLLQLALEGNTASGSDIDGSYTVEDEATLTVKEVKALRKLLKRKK